MRSLAFILSSPLELNMNQASGTKNHKQIKVIFFGMRVCKEGQTSFALSCPEFILPCLVIRSKCPESCEKWADIDKCRYLSHPVSRKMNGAQKCHQQLNIEHHHLFYIPTDL